jgi:hypothetical protein
MTDPPSPVPAEPDGLAVTPEWNKTYTRGFACFIFTDAYFQYRDGIPRITELFSAT